MSDDARKIRRLATRARRNAEAIKRGERPEAVKWEDVDAALTAGMVDGVPAGTDLDEFLWQTRPETRVEIESRNPERVFMPAEWAQKKRTRP